MRLAPGIARTLKAALVLAGAALALGVAVLYGMLAYRNHLPPFRTVQKLGRRRMTAMPPEVVPTAPPRDLEDLSSTGVAALIRIERPEDVLDRRAALVELLWGTRTLPTTLPSAITENFKDARYDLIPSLSRIDRLVVRMEFGLEHVLYHFVPARPNGRAVLYHEGHDAGFTRGTTEIVTLLDRGYGVVALSMPLLEPNNQPIVSIPGIGRRHLTSHRWMQFLKPPRGHPIKYFIEPVVVAVNYLERTLGVRDVSMIGFSGGAWTTTVAAAVDTRIVRSFPVAGSYPLYLRRDTEIGDYEDFVPAVDNVANYLEMYVLGSAGTGRKQLQILNRFDPCCFSGTRWVSYRDVVSERVRALGPGVFDVMMDETHRRHWISDAARARIISELDAAR